MWRQQQQQQYLISWLQQRLIKSRYFWVTSRNDQKIRKLPGWIKLFVSSFFISLITDGPQRHHPACGNELTSHLSPIHALQFFIAMQVQHSQIINQWLHFTQLSFSRFPLRKKERKIWFDKNLTHDFRTTSRCAGYLLDYSGGESICMVTHIASVRIF